MPLTIVKFGPDQLIFREGDVGNCAYLISSGSVDISIKKDGVLILIDRLGSGQIFGELALLDGAPRSATATTETGCQLRLITKEFLDREMERLDPFLQYWVLHAARINRRLLPLTDPTSDRRQNFQAGAKSSKAPLQVEPSSKLIEHVWGTTNRKSQVFDRRLFYPGQVIFREGEPGYKAFMIRVGTIQITKEAFGEPKVLAELGPNQLFGEFALVDNQPRSATAVVLNQAELLVVDGPRFRERLTKQSRFMQHWIRLLTGRVRDLSSRVA